MSMNKIGCNLFSKNFHVLGGGRRSETTQFMNAVGVPDDSTIYHASTAQEITGAAMWSAVQNNLVVPLLDYGIFNADTILYPLIVGTAAAHRWSLTTPIANAANHYADFYGGLTHDRFGITPDAATGFADPHFTPSADQTNADEIMHYNYSRLPGASVSTGNIFGARLSTSSSVMTQIAHRITGSLRQFSRINAPLASSTNSRTHSNTEGGFFHGLINNAGGEYLEYIHNIDTFTTGISAGALTKINNKLLLFCSSWQAALAQQINFSATPSSMIAIFNANIDQTIINGLKQPFNDFQVDMKRNLY